MKNVNNPFTTSTKLRTELLLRMDAIRSQAIWIVIDGKCWPVLAAYQREQCHYHTLLARLDQGDDAMLLTLQLYDWRDDRE